MTIQTVRNVERSYSFDHKEFAKKLGLTGEIKSVDLSNLIPGETQHVSIKTTETEEDKS